MTAPHLVHVKSALVAPGWTIIIKCVHFNSRPDSLNIYILQGSLTDQEKEPATVITEPRYNS